MRKWILVLALAAPAAAADVQCDYAGSQLEMNACAKRDYRAADAELNKAYYARLKGLAGSQQREALISQQRTWIKRRDARCKFKKGEGSDATINHLTCLQTLTEVRTLQLLR